MSQPRSALTLQRTPSKKKAKDSFQEKTEVEYWPVRAQEVVCELSDEEKEAEFNRMHEEYIQAKLERKRDILRRKREQFGASSSEQSDDSDEEIPPIMTPVKKQSHASGSGNGLLAESTYLVVIESKKNRTETELVVSSTGITIGTRQVGYLSITRMCIYSDGKGLKLRLTLSDDELVIGVIGDPEMVIRLMAQGMAWKLVSREIKMSPMEFRCSEEDRGSETAANCFIFDRILKKSQYLGSWDQRFIGIGAQGLSSYKSIGTKPTMKINTKQTQQLSTQFELIKGLLVLRLHYGGTKTQFGVVVDVQMRWVRQLAQMINT